jgi:hypothetical protein
MQQQQNEGNTETQLQNHTQILFQNTVKITQKMEVLHQIYTNYTRSIQ